jgi:hypothetical protein
VENAAFLHPRFPLSHSSPCRRKLDNVERINLDTAGKDQPGRSLKAAEEPRLLPSAFCFLP